ncbi:cryptochrome/photolyase family protein [Sphingomonas sp. KRR8]|uniref:cryptochrome/photolyase family protein n=1 Tax=Sphingomonas sp. KRR8 TaxID=2942996 RepID=UPI002020E628|nr:cryptochrome/photolyase family protein [Sphingomonas sp. KRR8]URD61524.1 cryptochrome/photolyase family protein [Sphingomonas sp. KRR8]
MTTLIPILGDQLSHDLASLRGASPASSVVLLMEVAEETGYVRHHPHKIILIFSAMRHFAAELRERGWTVDYIELEDPENRGSFTDEVGRALTRHGATSIRVVEAGEFRVARMIAGWPERFGVPVELLPDDRFICPLPDFFAWAGQADKPMEYFYRDQRRRTGLLMEPDGKPTGGHWNYDKDNRSGPPHQGDFPSRCPVEPDAVTRDVIELVRRRFSDHFGSVDGFGLPVTATQAEAALDEFIATRLPLFGTYQDAMVVGEALLFHAAISTSMNCGLLDPLTACRKVEAAFRGGKAPLNAAEGFIRQIIGWREYMRGMYWREMPALGEANALAATRPLPDFYWTGETDMKCLAESIRNTRDNAYAHHIQRLMVLGNFALLAGVAPQAISDWFLVVYADAYEWVEHPNVIGMSQWADGGRIATKPYAASGAYIDRMSDYCQNCVYDVKKKVGPRACPFNSLYWDFLARHEQRLSGNHRLRNQYATWRRMSPEKQAAYREWAQRFLDSLEPAEPGWARTN